MRRRAACFLCLGLLAGSMSAGATEIAAIAYHDIVLKRNGDPYAVTLEEFERQMEYLARAGYHPVSLRVLENARAGRAPLPSKPVLLSFDDGLKSYHEHAYPVLRRYRYPSVVSVVTSWIDARTTPENYATGFMTWDQLREIARSPDVEMVSHTDDLHRGLPANPAGSRLPAAVTRVYDPQRGYETEAEHARRVRGDLAHSVERLRTELGRAPLGIAWPYGEYDATLVQAAAALGMTYHLTLDMEPGRLEDLPRINRVALKRYRNIGDFADALTHKAYRKQQLRFVEIDLGSFAGKDPAEQERLLSRLLSRLEVLRVNAVLVDPFTADRRRAFFNNDVLPVEADLLSRLTQQLTRRTNLSGVYLRIPAISGVSPQVLYADLARLNWFNGVVFERAIDTEALDAARVLFKHYKPSVRIGVVADAGARAVDFGLVELAADSTAQTLSRRAAAALRDYPRALFLLRRSSATTEQTLRSAMQTLRAAGAQHYGYGPDDVLNDAPSVLGIVAALHEHTIAAVPR